MMLSVSEKETARKISHFRVAFCLCETFNNNSNNNDDDDDDAPTAAAAADDDSKRFI